MAPPATLEADVKDLRAQITTLKEEEAVDRKAADDLVESKKANGGDGYNALANQEDFEEIDAAYKKADAKKDKAANLTARISEILGTEAGSVIAETRGDPERTAHHLADRFLAGDSYRELRESGRLEMSNSRVDVAPVEILDLDQAMMAMAPANPHLAATLDGSALVPSDRRLLPPIGIPVRQVQLLDLITVGSTDSDTVEYTVEVTRTDNAGGADFGTALPESAYDWEIREATAKRRGHHVTATKGNLADQRQMRTIIDNRLISGSRRDLESQVLNGDGVGQNFAGMLGTAGIGTVAKGADTNADAIHKGMTVVRLALEDDITAVGLHPTDYETLVLEKDSDGRYLNGQGPHEATPRTVWGYPSVVSTVFAQGTSVPANWAEAATLWMRTGVSVGASDSHADYFLRGLVAIAAELRAAFGTTQPKAVCTVTGIA